jgi:hypothetical protein
MWSLVAVSARPGLGSPGGVLPDGIEPTGYAVECDMGNLIPGVNHA